MKALNKYKPRRGTTNLAVKFPLRHKLGKAIRLGGIFAKGFIFPATRQADITKRADNQGIGGPGLRSASFSIKPKGLGTVLLTNNK